jgi:hypothetical protein
MKNFDWKALHRDLLENGFVITPIFLNPKECQTIQGFYDSEKLYRSTI